MNNKLMERRQRGQLKCVICGKKLRRFPTKNVYSKVINGVRHYQIFDKDSGYQGTWFIDRHLKCADKTGGKNE